MAMLHMGHKRSNSSWYKIIITKALELFTRIVTKIEDEQDNVTTL